MTDVTKAQDGGILKTVITEGTGSDGPGQGDTVIVHYVGTLAEGGEKFDSSRDRGEEFSFTLGRGQVIKGWDEGVASMKKGEKANLLCKPDYAYGAAGSPPKIPADATLNFEVELIRWEGEDISTDRDKSIMRSTKTEGSGYDSPNDGATVTVDVAGTCAGKSFVDKTDLVFVCGEASEVGLPDGLDKALKRMKKGERSQLTLAPKAGFGAKGRPELSIPPNAELVLDVTLKDFVKEKDSWQMSDDEKLTKAAELKQKGTDFFKAGKLKLAAGKYGKIKDLLEYVDKLEGEKKAERDALLLASHLNLALVYLKKGEPVEAVREAEKALGVEPGNAKALYRKASGHLDAKDFELACVDFRALLQVEPSNKAAAAGLAKAKAAISEEKARASKTFKGMFDKFAAKDAKKQAAASPPPADDKAEEKPMETNGTNGEAAAATASA